MSPLRRTGPPQRKTPLTSSKPLSRGSSLPRSPLVRKAPEKPVDWVRRSKPLSSARPKVSDAEKRARELVYARSGWVCEGCRQARAAEWAHRVTRRVGPWCPANGLHLCNDLTARPGKRGCHEWCHGKDRPEAEALGWILRTTHDYLTTPVWLPAHGRVLLGTDGSIATAQEVAA